MATPESDLTLAGLTIYQVITEHFSELISDHQVYPYIIAGIYTLPSFFSG